MLVTCQSTAYDQQAQNVHEQARISAIQEHLCRPEKSLILMQSNAAADLVFSAFYGNAGLNVSGDITNWVGQLPVKVPHCLSANI